MNLLDVECYRLITRGWRQIWHTYFSKGCVSSKINTRSWWVLLKVPETFEAKGKVTVDLMEAFSVLRWSTAQALKSVKEDLLVPDLVFDISQKVYCKDWRLCADEKACWDINQEWKVCWFEPKFEAGTCVQCKVVWMPWKKVLLWDAHLSMCE